MKSQFVFASLVALSGFAGFASIASASTDFSIRVNVGSPHRPIVSSHSDCGPEVRNHRHHHAPRGYWKEVIVKTWVPGRWIVTCDRRGREVRTYERGHYRHRTDRVWVEYGRDHGGRGRHGRS